AKRRDADAGQEVQILAAVGVIQAHAVAADESHRIASIRLQHMSRLARDDAVHHHGHAGTILINRVADGGAAATDAASSAARSRAMPMQAMTGTNPAARSVCSTLGSAFSAGTPTLPRSTVRPSTAWCGGAACESPHAPSAPVNPTAATPALLSAAVSRVL